jgi:NAD(P)-dependent dehydrogenase (short-subunit alcohol dehydrogenase family)
MKADFLRLIAGRCALGWAWLAIVVAMPSHAATVLITGANSGIGLEFSQQYAAAGWTVIATHHHERTPDTLAKLSAQYRNVRVETLDVTSAAQAHALAAKLKDVPIDVLINNAGVFNDRGKWDTQNFRHLDYSLGDTIMAVNVKGPLIVSEAFVDLVKASAQKKIIAISSTNGSLSLPTRNNGAIFYRSSKAALNRAMQLVAAELKPEGITVVMLHPGAVRAERTPNTDNPEAVELPLSVKQMIATINALTPKDAGRFMRYDGETLPW